MDDTRLPFPDAREAFVAFLRTQGWPTDVLWLSRDRIVGRRGRFWVYRPEELTGDAASGEFYEAARRTATNLRIDALGQFGGRTLAYVQDYGGHRRMLNFGVPERDRSVRQVRSRVAWSLLCAFTRLAGESPLLRSSRITGEFPPAA
jgi:hypothetical protein